MFYNSSVDIKLLPSFEDNNLELPAYATVGSAGMDLRACVEKPVKIHANQISLISTGICLYIKDVNIVGLLVARSGLSVKNGITLINSVGIIDSSYQGEIKVALWNTSEVPFVVNSGDRICQLLFMPVTLPQLNIVTEFSEVTQRGEGGFGHTGIK